MSEKQYIIPTLPLSCDVETKAVLKQTTLASRKLGELNGIVEQISADPINSNMETDVNM